MRKFGAENTALQRRSSHECNDGLVTPEAIHRELFGAKSWGHLLGTPGSAPPHKPLTKLRYSGQIRNGAGEGNRTLVFSLEGCCSTIELHPRDAYITDIGARLNEKSEPRAAGGKLASLYRPELSELAFDKLYEIQSYSYTLLREILKEPAANQVRISNGVYESFPPPVC
jgi:hypothetical protein